MSDSFPKISVLMPVYNGACYLEESIESILHQTFTDFEFIIIDDASTDSTWAILTKYSQQDQRIRLFKNEANLGLTKSLNKGLMLAQGEYIARQDADDVSLLERFQKQTAMLEQHPAVILVSCDLELIDSKGNHIRKLQRACEPTLVAWHLLFFNYIAGHSQVMFRRQPAMELGGYSETRRYCEDYELWSRLVKVGDIVISPEVLLKYRLHNQSVSAKRKSEQDIDIIAQSKSNIRQLIGEELSLEEVTELNGFWLVPDLWVHFPPKSNRVGVLHSRLKQIYQAFLQQTAQQNSPDLKTSRRLRILIGKQLIFWIQTLSIRQNLLLKLRISRHAFVWSPLGVLDCWLRELWKIPLFVSRTLLRLHHTETFKPNQ